LEFQDCHRFHERVLHDGHVRVGHGIRQPFARQPIADSRLLVNRQLREQIRQYGMKCCDSAFNIIEIIHGTILIVEVDPSVNPLMRRFDVVIECE
jgi:hypothetical protein